MTRLVKYLQSIRKWSPWKERRKETEEDVMNIVAQEIETNAGTTLVVHKFGRQIRSRVIYIPLQGWQGVVVRRIGRRCQVKKGDLEFEMDAKAFNALWRTCTDKNYKYIVK